MMNSSSNYGLKIDINKCLNKDHENTVEKKNQ